MNQSLPFGPFTVPTGPIFAMFAVVLALEVAGRMSRKVGVRSDDLWNTGLLGLLAALIVARLWTIIQFWDVYRTEPGLIVSLRPSGFAFWPGVAAFVVAAYANLLRQKLDPRRVAAALAVGMAAGAILINVSSWLTGAVVGLPTDVPWAVRYFIEIVHPVALYRAVGLVLVVVLGWATTTKPRAGRTVWLVVLGFGLVHLISDAWVRDPALLGSLRQSQVLGLAAAVAASLMLARKVTGPSSATAEPAAPPVAEPKASG